MKKIAIVLGLTLVSFLTYAKQIVLIQQSTSIEQDTLLVLPAATTYQYAMRDSALYLDVYKATNAPLLNKTVVYVFGGGFAYGTTTDPKNLAFYDSLLHYGFNVISVDYRLAMKGVKKAGISQLGSLFRAVDMASDDIIAATKYILDNHIMLGVDTSKIVLVGSSAGAMTVLKTDYRVTNVSKSDDYVRCLPSTFRYAGVVSMGGMLLYTQGKPKYKYPPAPTLFFHGTDDDIVTYKKRKLFNLGMFGTKALTSYFDKSDYSYVSIVYEGSKHEVADFPRRYNVGDIIWFINDVALRKRKLRVKVLINDAYVKEHYYTNITMDNLYN